MLNTRSVNRILFTPGRFMLMWEHGLGNKSIGFYPTKKSGTMLFVRLTFYVFDAGWAFPLIGRGGFEFDRNLEHMSPWYAQLIHQLREGRCKHWGRFYWYREPYKDKESK